MKKIFCILGLPRTGTTLLCNFLKQKNSICFVEPIWLKINQEKFQKSNKFTDPFIDKMLPVKSTQVIKKCLEISSDSNLTYYIKETFQPNNKENIKIIDKNLSLFSQFIILKRNPFCVFSSWKKTDFGKEYSDVDIFIDCFVEFEKYIKKIPNKKIINYEKFCAKNIGKKYKSVPSKFGDEKCKNNFFINEPNKDISNIEQKEFIKIKKAISKIL